MLCVCPPSLALSPSRPRSLSRRHFIKKYNRYEKRHKNVPAHCSPAFKLNIGDNIIVGQVLILLALLVLKYKY